MTVVLLRTSTLKRFARPAHLAPIKQIHQPSSRGKSPIGTHQRIMPLLWSKTFQCQRVVAVQRVPGDETAVWQAQRTYSPRRAEIAGFTEITVLNIAFQLAQFRDACATSAMPA